MNNSFNNIDCVWLDVNVATLTPESPYGIIKDAAIAVTGDKIVWLGKQCDLPSKIKNSTKQSHSCAGKWLTPGLIDCHTHLIYAGNRAHEFEMRLQGASYAEIAQAGGGIRSTVKNTRAASFETLYQQSARRLKALLAEGVTTVEIKSGYGLDLVTELKLLRVARQLGEDFPVTIKTSFLGAHALPLEFANDTDGYINFICEEVLPAIAAENLADAVDAFCETIAFTPEQTAKVFATAKQYQLPVKLHAEQLSDLKGATLAAQHNALSADHLEFICEESIIAMAKSGTVAVLLPGAYYYLREKQLPPIDLFRQHHVPIAIATDNNPGTSPVTSLLLMLNMACTLFFLTPEEALIGVTRNAAKALGMADTHGTLEVGKTADFVIWDIEHPAELAYHVGFNPKIHVVKNGRII